MAWCPFAVHKPIAKKRKKITPRALIAHTAVSGADSLYGYFSGVGDDSHFYIRPDGGLEQYVDTTEQAFANRDANDFAISFESADGKDPARNPWTPAQLTTIIRLANWVADTHPTVPRRQITDPYGSGIGWHAMFGAPSAWTKAAGKTCPAGPRINQMKTSVIPAFISRSGGGGGSTAGKPVPTVTEETEPMILEASTDRTIVIPTHKAKTELFLFGTMGSGVTIIEMFGIGDTPKHAGPDTTFRSPQNESHPAYGKIVGKVDSDRPGPIGIGEPGRTRGVVLRYACDRDFTADVR